MTSNEGNTVLVNERRCRLVWQGLDLVSPWNENEGGNLDQAAEASKGSSAEALTPRRPMRRREL